MIKITIPFRTPSINHLFWHKGNMKFMKTVEAAQPPSPKGTLFKVTPENFHPLLLLRTIRSGKAASFTNRPSM
ncbi:hypothetical protein LCGC14_1938460 [marine sediment metagenome]|uniref:Uncharacterized protein n=1 Tax=marine sediment metagenome TaxID=412755 RepID=A0A0F9FL91_9ZZZZ